ncbi:MAG TPA: two-component regulator propeller domain-containing protein [Segetibacter sp.]|jgi:hypothetical protein
MNSANFESMGIAVALDVYVCLEKDDRCNTLKGASQAKPNAYFIADYKILFYLISSFFFLNQVYSQSQLQPVGQWREHLPYQNTIQVVQGGNEMFAATINNVFSVDEKNNITRYSKVTGLNDIGVSAIAWDEALAQLVIAYNNSNIDVIKNRIVRNISDIKRSNITGNKAINYIYCKDKIAYLCSGLGVIVVDLEKSEIKDTWQIGSGGGQVKINGFTSDGSSYYAATDEGLKRASISSTNLADYRNWQSVGSFGNGPVKMVSKVSDKIVALKNDSIYVVNGNASTIFYADATWPIVSINIAAEKLLVTQRTAVGSSRVLVLNSNGTIDKTLMQPGVISFPRWATVKDDAVWVADFFGGLSKFDNGSFERYIPDGPLGSASGEMVVNKGSLYVAAGEVSDAWNYQFNRNGIYNFTEGRWSNIGAFNTPSLDTVLDFITVAIDPKDESLWAGSYGGGLVSISSTNQVKIYKQNSSLQPAVGDPKSYRVSGLAFDQNNNLWISNYGAPQNLHVRKADGTFKFFSIPFFHFENAVSQVVVDDANQLWIVSPRGNGVFVYNQGANVDAVNDDKWKYFRVGKGSGNLPSNEVFSVAKDKNGFIWIGTAAGIGIVQCPEQVFEVSGCEAILPVVQQDQFAGFLFQNEEVKTIAVDGANRKWIGTRNGVWLISEDGEKIIYRFTEDNSPLLSNDVKKIAIDPQSGEVYISTFKGICSFRSTATDAQVKNNKILVFPNPVPPGYNGTIAIRGVTNNSTAKIAELNGRVVYQTRALGGQAVWNGRNYKGDKVASGIYLILVKDDNGVERQVSKIVIAGGR